MEAYEPKQLPLDCIDWSAHVPLMGQASADLASREELENGLPAQ